jgi:hypothetical protein
VLYRLPPPKLLIFQVVLLYQLTPPTYKMFENASSRAKLPDRSRATLVKIFDDFEPVAHFWTATIILPELWRNRANSGADLASFLGAAEQIRMMGERVRLDLGLLLDPEKTWKVPDRFVLPRWEIPLPSPSA